MPHRAPSVILPPAGEVLAARSGRLRFDNCVQLPAERAIQLAAPELFRTRLCTGLCSPLWSADGSWVRVAIFGVRLRRHEESMASDGFRPGAAGGSQSVTAPSSAMSSSRLFLGGLLASRARFRFADRSHAPPRLSACQASTRTGSRLRRQPPRRLDPVGLLMEVVKPGAGFQSRPQGKKFSP